MAHPLRLPLLLAVASAVYTFYKWDAAPEKVPFWWSSSNIPTDVSLNANGAEPVSWAPKWQVLCLLPLLQFVIPYIWYQIAVRDPRLQQQSAESKHAAAHVISIPALFLFSIHMFAVMDAATDRRHELPINVFPTSFALWLLIWFGFNIAAIERNSSIGVLTPWSVAKESNWKQTHALASHALVLSGFMLLLLSPFTFRSEFIVLTLVLWLVSSVLFSFCISRSGSSDETERLLQ